MTRKSFGIGGDAPSTSAAANPTDNAPTTDEQLASVGGADVESEDEDVYEEQMAEDEIHGRQLADRLLKLSRGELKSRVAGVLDRGILHDRLKVDLPGELHGEWVRNDPLEIDRLRSLGFWIDNKYATNRRLHGDGTAANIVGDVVFMVCSRELKEVIDDVRAEQQEKLHGKRQDKAGEESQFAEQTARGTGGIVPTFTESKARTIDRAEVAAALKRADSQTNPQGG